jgi:hypothetical protein
VISSSHHDYCFHAPRPKVSRVLRVRATKKLRTSEFRFPAIGYALLLGRMFCRHGTGVNVSDEVRPSIRASSGEKREAHMLFAQGPSSPRPTPTTCAQIFTSCLGGSAPRQAGDGPIAEAKHRQTRQKLSGVERDPGHPFAWPSWCGEEGTGRLGEGWRGGPL